MVHIEFDSKSQVVNCIMKDKIVVEDVTRFIKSMICADDLPKDLRIIVHLLNCEVLFNVDQIPEIVKANDYLLERYVSIRQAIVIDKPISTALAVYYKKLCKQSNYSFKIFSTLIAAEFWIKSN